MLQGPKYGLLLTTLLFARSLAAGGAQIVDLGYARYEGSQPNSKTVVFYGIPYAEPPLGERRFRAPVPLVPSRITAEQPEGGAIDATQPPDFCIQKGNDGSENCLKVNIYKPHSATPDSKLPVLFYIHGGAGNPVAWPFDHWIEYYQDVVIVSVYYRLSFLGSLAPPEFKDSNLGDFNVGLLDRIEALKWVRQHISRFGGNPSMSLSTARATEVPMSIST
ncbi:hypothetical protein HGRIS_012294 [Hohenbuehelia grisea]|uniref:Carboxylesterase type B domain-containing protein n=1 Tax=Hohenbuehelia grisea TaxID=104357 RepID=A0ABR3IRW0_9AGAR